jgi:hypothetical protein
MLSVSVWRAVMIKIKIFFLCIVLFLGISDSIVADIIYPESLKKEIRCYPHANITQTMDIADMAMAKLTVTDRFSNILVFYNKELNKMGWEISTVTKKENKFTIFAEKGKKNLVIDAGHGQSGDSTIRIRMDKK